MGEENAHYLKWALGRKKNAYYLKWALGDEAGGRSWGTKLRPERRPVSKWFVLKLSGGRNWGTKDEAPARASAGIGFAVLKNPLGPHLRVLAVWGIIIAAQKRILPKMGFGKKRILPEVGFGGKKTHTT